MPWDYLFYVNERERACFLYPVYSRNGYGPIEREGRNFFLPSSSICLENYAVDFLTPIEFPIVILQFTNLVWRNNNTEWLAPQPLPQKVRVKEHPPNRDPCLPSPIKDITVSSRQYHISQENQLLSHLIRALETGRKSRTFPELQSGPRNKEVSLPDLAVGGRCLCDDRAGLGWRHGLLNHNTGVMVGHPCAAKLVSSRPCHGPTNCIMHRDILPREDRGERSEEANVLSYFQTLKDQNWESGYVN